MSRPDIPLVEAHRGDSSRAPENTLAAFASAVDLGVPWIELDVHPAADGTLMVIHDETVDRTTDGRGPVRGFAVEALRRLDAGSWFAPEFAGERIPLLDEVLGRVAPTATRLNIEIKASPPGADVPRAVVELLRSYGVENDYIVSSFQIQPLLEIRAIDPGISLALIGKLPRVLSVAEGHGFPWVHVDYRTVTTEAVRRAQASRIRVNAWTVDDLDWLPRLLEAGVDKICSNRPAAIQEALEKHLDSG